jgi:hypothetical protein
LVVCVLSSADRLTRDSVFRPSYLNNPSGPALRRHRRWYQVKSPRTHVVTPPFTFRAFKTGLPDLSPKRKKRPETGIPGSTRKNLFSPGGAPAVRRSGSRRPTSTSVTAARSRTCRPVTGRLERIRLGMARAWSCPIRVETAVPGIGRTVDILVPCSVM